MRYTSFVSIAVRKTQSEALGTAISKMPQPLFISPDTKRIIIKPSIFNPGLPGNTSFGMMKAVTEFFKEVASISIVESDNPWRSTDDAFEKCNLHTLLGDSVELVNLSAQPMVDVAFPSYHLKKEGVPDLIVRNDFLVNLATLKKQDEIALGAGIKNLLGLLPMKDKSVYHDHLNEVLLDLLTIFKPRLSIIDLTYLVEGKREEKKQRTVGGVILGIDPVAVDAFCADLIGLDPLEVPYLRRANELGIGEALPERIQVFGTDHQKRQLRMLCAK